MPSNPKLSVIVVIFNMVEEAKKTLYSLSSAYQKGVDADDYEVIVIDNGSTNRVPLDFQRSLGSSFKFFYIDNAPPSPAYAINYGVQRSEGKILSIMIDGARITTPNIVKYTLLAFKAFKRPVVTTLAWHIGPDIHRRAVSLYGHNKTREIELLRRINWRSNGYRLFEISTLAGSSKAGWFSPKSESSYLSMNRVMFDRLQGFDERFDFPGGGLVNLDIYKRACDQEDSDLVMILGEGVFHQMHGGAMTGASEQESMIRMKNWRQQYKQIRGKEFSPPEKTANYIGHIPPQILPSIIYSAGNVLKKYQLSGRM